MVPNFTVKPLDPSTWADFAALAERHNGVWGGCWCMEFHPEGAQRGPGRREAKQARVSAGSAHAALVFDGSACVGWCQFGSPEELPRIKLLRAYRQGLEQLPDWRITCFFVDKAYRKQGVSAVALAGALAEIARLGGGLVESYPQDPAGRSVSAGFLYNSSLSTFEKQGFKRVRQLGQDHWVVQRLVEAGAPARAD
jgi:GNAT superfamily N-acetyltransferase